jgi:teichoic acid transport system ATP-binding protein
VTFILVTHSTEAAIEFCERGLVLKDGELAFDGKIADAAKYYEKS